MSDLTATYNRLTKRNRNYRFLTKINQFFGPQNTKLDIQLWYVELFVKPKPKNHIVRVKGNVTQYAKLTVGIEPPTSRSVDSEVHPASMISYPYSPTLLIQLY
ncbi:hypothetical protein M8J77_020514 [Diaphorina citri]|nr:hypothetical protein M8J77_020514 [Diaphorina citri]